MFIHGIQFIHSVDQAGSKFISQRQHVQGTYKLDADSHALKYYHFGLFFAFGGKNVHLHIFSLKVGVNFTNPNVPAHKVCHNQFCQQNSAQLYQYTQLEVTSTFYALFSALYTSKFSVNPLAQKVLITWWWNYPQVTKFTIPSVHIFESELQRRHLLRFRKQWHFGTEEKNYYFEEKESVFLSALNLNLNFKLKRKWMHSL